MVVQMVDRTVVATELMSAVDWVLMMVVSTEYKLAGMKADMMVVLLDY